MTRFRCPVCETYDAQPIEAIHGDLGVSCGGCCVFEITNEATEKMINHRFKFDVDVARWWLKRERDAGKVPLITWLDAAKMVRSPDADGLSGR